MKLVNVCARVAQRRIWIWSQQTHYPSADKRHQLQLLGGLCCHLGERGKVLLNGVGDGGVSVKQLAILSKTRMMSRVSASMRPPVVSSAHTPPPLFSLLESMAILVSSSNPNWNTT